MIEKLNNLIGEVKMWELQDLRDPDIDQACINGKWVPARPENYKRACMTFRHRLVNAWSVFMCKSEAFKWPEDQ